MGYCENFCSKYGEALYVIFRVLVGLMFFMHGWQKIFVNGAALSSLMGVAGIVEILVGLGVLVGFFTRLAAFGGAITMVVGYFMMHAKGGLSPLANGGELAVMYFVAFLVLMQFGARKWSLERQLLKKEMF